MARASLIQASKIKLGLFDNSTATFSSIVNTGVITNSGVTFLGLPGAVGAARAAVMIGPAMGLSLPASLEVVGISTSLVILIRLVYILVQEHHFLMELRLRMV